ncbi:MAG: hypothetical protein K8I30_13255 [Anaerolineae bacterium]|nr:hypothetical protein [Anaerolineae bacterium]
MTNNQLPPSKPPPPPQRRRRIRPFRTILTLAIIVALVASAIAGLSLALFLQTFIALTREIPVAEVVMSPIQSDEKGQYMDIQFTPYAYESALLHIFNPDDPTATGNPPLGTPHNYRVYGDTVAVRGPLVKLHPALLILNFNNIFKLSLIEGEYRQSGSISQGEGSEFPINGGFDDSWWNFNSREALFPYNLIVDRFTISGDEEPGFFGAGKKRYQVVVTMDSITWNFIENIPPG